ncbi:kinesin-like protein KIF13A isoform X1 [Bemisia tabaci]|uniref:kinesin-like protein KIF13A isoform X1 n=1 Tax=Bemisia tabaci TaxID=7038 RepID=UPI003B28AF93
MSDKINVAVRVRPFNRRELELGTECVVEMDGQQTLLHHPPSNDEKAVKKAVKTFAFDHCFFSLDDGSPQFASQEMVFNRVGRDILDNAFQGYNACIFAYGQTGSGKSYTMMGSQDNKGIIPRLCDALFERIAQQQSSELSYKVEVSYMEIYNEKVHDLLDPKTNKQSLKVREHNVLGPYVDGLSQLAVTSYQDIDNLMAEGNKSRTVAATNMNSESSRSHAVFSVVLTQTLTDEKSGVSGEKVARISLVDLAGSERAVKTGAVGDRLKEGSNINKSLTTLGLVISKLADQSINSKSDKFVPYRDSVLTWLLKDNLGGNSRTVMVATISPAADNYEETLSTLRYADRAKRIVNHAVVNEDPNARIIRELRQEVEALKEMLMVATGTTQVPELGSHAFMHREDLHEKLSESEKLMKEMSQTWEEKLIKTERLQHERQEALENMGISVQASGISVEKNKYYLVNLNADPSLNELLVYYLKDKTLIGSHQCDIQLSGLGIQPEHCEIVVEGGNLFLEPRPGARCCVNGVPVSDRTPLQHGDRILWGNHHFFRLNCPKASSTAASEPQTPAQTIDYNFAREELMLNELSNDPIQTAIARIERQHEEDKQVALEKQRQEYERQFQHLRNILSPSTPYSPYVPFDPFRFNKMTPCTPTTQLKVEKWAKDRDENFRRSLSQLKRDIVKANTFVQEANFLAEELNKQIKYSVTLQIPPENLSPNRRRGAFVSEPAILVKRKGLPNQVWSMEKLENKLIDMREMYDEQEEKVLNPSEEESQLDRVDDPFFETQENHSLIGVANIFLEALFHDVSLDYHTPVISQQGEVAGRLQVEISRISGTFPQDRLCEAASESSGDSGHDEEEPPSTHITVRVHIKQASGLPLALSNFVFCQYSFWGYPDATSVPATANPDTTNTGDGKNSIIFQFDHVQDFVIPLTEEFMEHCTEGALSIEVWGHPSAGFTKTKPGWEVEQQQMAKARSLVDRWNELKRKVELWVEVQELNDAGEYSAVEVTQRPDILTGGTYQLRQGQQRRILVTVKPVAHSGTLPLIVHSIVNIAVGSVTVRSRLQKPLDSYQEEDLAILREKWSDALMRRKQYLDQHIQRLINKQDKTEEDVEREQSLVDQWVSLTEERNAVLVPAPGSGIPGAPADWDSPPGMEPHIPVLFLDLNPDDLSASGRDSEEIPVAGLHSILPKEHGNKFYSLPLVRRCLTDVSAVGTWDSSVHDNIHLNKITDSNERVYLILKTTVRLSHPASMDLVLRKRLSLNIFKKQSLTERIRKRITRSDWLLSTGVTYEVVSNVPKASEELEDRESLAQIAASGETTSSSDGESYIEKYTRGVSAVESILMLDRLRQSVAVRELLQSQPAVDTPVMRKTASVPNFSQMMRFDSGLDGLGSCNGFVTRSESMADFNADIRDFRSRKSLPETDLTQQKQFGIARPTFLNLNINLNSLRLQPGSKSSPNAKLGLRMTTLHEEQSCAPNDDEDGEERFVEPVITSSRMRRSKSNLLHSRHYESDFDTHETGMKDRTARTLPNSRTLDSLAEFQGAKMTPSTTSSGYGSEAVSSSNLTNEDASSIRSINADYTPDFDCATQSIDKAITELSISKPREENASESLRTSEIQEMKMEERSSGSSSGEHHHSADDDTLTLSSDKVVRRKKSSTRSQQSRASFPQAKGQTSEEKPRLKLDQQLNSSSESTDERNTTEDDMQTSFEDVIPDWVAVGERVLIRPYGSSGVIGFVGTTQFAVGIWIGVELDAPTGKNDGTVQGVKYFDARPKHGIFVRVDKLIQDRRGARAMKSNTLPRAPSKGEGLNKMGRNDGNQNKTATLKSGLK